jgi:uncharacterized protein YaaQ
MDIDDEDADELLSALSKNGFGMPFLARVAEYGNEGVVLADEVTKEANRNAIRKAMESTQAWSRWRLY